MNIEYLGPQTRKIYLNYAKRHFGQKPIIGEQILTIIEHILIKDTFTFKPDNFLIEYEKNKILFTQLILDIRKNQS